jgi:hypothetical protein
MSDNEYDHKSWYLHQKVIDFADEMLDREYNPLEVAAAQMVNAMRIYRTIMPEDQYDSMMKNVFETRKNVQPFSPAVLN